VDNGETMHSADDIDFVTLTRPNFGLETPPKWTRVHAGAHPLMLRRSDRLALRTCRCLGSTSRWGRSRLLGRWAGSRTFRLVCAPWRRIVLKFGCLLGGCGTNEIPTTSYPWPIERKFFARSRRRKNIRP